MITYRMATADDAPQMSAVSSECGADKWSEAAFLPEFEHGSIVMCAEDDGKIVGFLVVGVSFDEGYLHLISTCSDYKRQGIASRLLNECERVAALRSVNKIVLDVRVSNISAISLYEKFGYKTICTRRGFYSNPKEDAFTMVKELECK